MIQVLLIQWNTIQEIKVEPDTCKNMYESKIHYAEDKMGDTNGYILYDSIYWKI